MIKAAFYDTKEYDKPSFEQQKVRRVCFYWQHTPDKRRL